MRFSLLFLIIITLGFGAAGAEEIWVDFGSHRSASPTEVQIGRSDSSVLELELEVPGVILEAISAEGLAFTRVEMPGAGSIGDIGAPQLPAFRRFVEMPEGATVTVDSNVIEWQTVDLADRGLSGLLLPAQLSIPKCDCQEARDWRFSFKEAAYSGIVEHDLVSVEAPVTMRDHRMVKLAFAPIQYDVDAGTLHIASRVSIRLTFEGGDDVATLAKKGRLSNRAFDGFLGRATLNLGFSDSVNGRVAGWAYPDDAPIEFLIVTPQTFVSDLQPFVDWKTSCGYNVTVVTTAVTGTTTADIKAYITGLYNGATPPVYILMIGDSPGVLATYTTSNAGGGTDLPFVQMDGDLFPDMMIARWPIDDSTELINMRDKILHYEQPTAANSGWLNRALFLAGDDYIPNGVTTHEDVRAELLDPPPNSAETEQWWGDTENPTTAELIADLNTGRAWAVYSAHSGPGGWSGDPSLSNGDMPNFGNTDMYPIAHGHSCSSNEWASNGDVFGEAAVIQPSKGFVSYWGGSNSTYWDGDDWLEKGFFDSLVEADMADNTGVWDGQFSAVASCYAGLSEVSLRGGGSAGETYYWEIYNLNGDPTLDPFTRQPTAINVGAPAAIPPSATDAFTVAVTDASAAPVSGALVAASQGGVLLGAGYTDGTGTAVFHIDAPAPGSPMLVRVTAHNYLPTDESVMTGAEADGVVTLNATIYPCAATAVIDVFDANATGPFLVTLRTAPGNSTSVTMTEVGDVAGHFQGSAVLGADLVVSDGDTLSAIYNDEDTGAGTETKTVTASVDCAGPVISNVVLSVSEGSMTVTFDTNEPGTTIVRYGTSTPPVLTVSSSSLVTSHSVLVEGLDSCTTYFVKVASDDALGNRTLDNNGGAFYSEETSGWQTFFSEDFSTDPGWTIDNGGNLHGWAYGIPTGGGGEYGGPDPTSGFTGDSVYGVNLAGDYDNSLTADKLKLTTPAIDCSEATSVFLSFRRWLGVEQPSYDHARVQVSVDGGTSWSTTWQNDGGIEDSGWSEQTLDLTAVAAGQPDLRVRWTQGATDGSWQYCGWNIDDVVVEGAAPCGPSSALFLDGFETGDCTLWSVENP